MLHNQQFAANKSDVAISISFIGIVVFFFAAKSALLWNNFLNKRFAFAICIYINRRVHNYNTLEWGANCKQNDGESRKHIYSILFPASGMRSTPGPLSPRNIYERQPGFIVRITHIHSIIRGNVNGGRRFKGSIHAPPTPPSPPPNRTRAPAMRCSLSLCLSYGAKYSLRCIQLMIDQIFKSTYTWMLNYYCKTYTQTHTHPDCGYIWGTCDMWTNASNPAGMGQASTSIPDLLGNAKFSALHEIRSEMFVVTFNQEHICILFAS